MHHCNANHNIFQLSKLNAQLLAIILLLALASCQSLEPFSIDYMQPGRISFPDELTRVGIVNNVPNELPNQLSRYFTDQPDVDTPTHTRQTSYFNGVPSLTIESLAQSIADAQYFEQVVICDSALRAHDEQLRASGLTPQEVSQLANDLGVDMLISLESVQLREVKEMIYVASFGVFAGDIAVNVKPVLQLYLPGRETAVANINATDSIYWQEVGNTMQQVRSRLVSNEEMLRQASDFAGTIPMKMLLPYWETARRYFFTSGNVKMRDGVVYARENHWDQAQALWTEAYNGTSSKKKQFFAAYNLALACEMQDQIEEACTWANLAVEKAPTPEYLNLAKKYQNELDKRKGNLSILKAQLNRFKDQ